MVALRQAIRVPGRANATVAVKAEDAQVSRGVRPADIDPIQRELVEAPAAPLAEIELAVAVFAPTAAA
jgi:hypothetical protein